MDLFLLSAIAGLLVPSNNKRQPALEQSMITVAVETPSTSASSKLEYPDEIKNEIYSRVESFFGASNFSAVRKSFVIIVGLGGVGSHAANMLARSGVQRLRLVDFDQVSLSSLNRHAVAVLEDVGKPKAEVVKKRLLSVVPWCDIDARVAVFNFERADQLLSGNPDYVVDCIDDVNTKAELIAYCHNNNIKVLTSMGAGGKADPTRSVSDCVNE